MTLIKSISGIRGTIGGKPEENLTPLDIVKFTSAYGMWIKKRYGKEFPLVVIGRDARLSGMMVKKIVKGTLNGLGINILDLDLSTTPTVEVAVVCENAQGGIILTASHNPEQWNALKLLNEKGEFISEQDGTEILEMAELNRFEYADVHFMGGIVTDSTWIGKHIDLVLKLPLVDVEAIRAANFSIVVDAVNSSGGIAVPLLLEKLGVNKITPLYCEPTGHFPHNPEPLPEHLHEISKVIIEKKADLGIVVDPDVDRLALVCEDGSMFGEEYTLVAVADYVLLHTPGNTVSNLSSTRALRDVTEEHRMQYFASAVGEVNVVKMMKEKKAIIGGEGNGGIIYPELHYGRDALVGIALFLSHLAKKKMKASELRKSYPSYFISKNKIELTPNINTDEVIEKMDKKYATSEKNTVDGLKIILNNKEWVHLRKSNTEPIIRVYAESDSFDKSVQLGERFVKEMKESL